MAPTPSFRAFPGGPVRSDGRAAFTYIELLAVMSVAAVLMALVVPAVVGRNRNSGLSRSVYLFSGALERARADAMARNVYRYVAVEPTTVSGNATLLVKTLGCRNGVRFPGPSTPPASLLAATITLNQVQIADFADDKPPRAAADQKLAELPASFRLSVTGLFNNAFLFECAPGGGVTLVEDAANDKHTLYHWIETGLRPIRGASVADTGNYAIVQIAGLTGQTQVYRP